MRLCQTNHDADTHRRLDKALAQVRASPSAENITFTLHFNPFQLYPDFPETADKKEWSLHNKHLDNPEGQKAFEEHMKGLTTPLGINMRFDGSMGNTLPAHRVVQLVQDKYGEQTTSKLIDSLYRMYFTEAKHPAEDETLISACVEAGVDEAEAKALVQDGENGLRQAKERLRTTAMDVDAVPVVVVEGRRRDLTLTGAKEVGDYVKALETVIKEST